MEQPPKQLLGIHWQPMGSDAPPAWLEGYEKVFDWFLNHATSEEVFESLLKYIQETLEAFKAGSKRQVDFHLKLNTSGATISVIHEKKESHLFKGHEGRIVLGEESTGETLAERLFFVFMKDGVAEHVVPRAQIL